MAIGMGHMLGFDFLENFNYPYVSCSVQEFWRRWHISLSSWFRDYLYIPLGGNRRGKVRTYINLIIVFACTGLWHGASFSFIVWGLWHGLFLVIERLGFKKVLDKLPKFIGWIYTMLVVLVGWVFFRADTLADAKVILHQMFTWENGIYPASLFVNRKVIFLAVLGVLLSDGFELETDPAKADAIIVNTCGFINDAKKESIDKIFEMSAYKHAGKKLVVSGCLSERYSKELFDEMPEVDCFIGVNEYERLPEILRNLHSRKNLVSGCVGETLPRMRRKLDGNPFTSTLKIAEGCNNYCAYCVIPSIRGGFAARRWKMCWRRQKSLRQPAARN